MKGFKHNSNANKICNFWIQAFTEAGQMVPIVSISFIYPVLFARVKVQNFQNPELETFKFLHLHDA